MPDFTKYQHVERLGHQETDGLLDGEVYVYPKIDGTNASVWSTEDGGLIHAGSRNRKLSLENDNAGFFKWVIDNIDTSKKWDIFYEFPDIILYGEWLVPHSLKTYRDDAWRDFYVFDVLDTVSGELLSYDTYKPFLEAYGINYIPPLAIFRRPSNEDLLKVLDKNFYLLKDGDSKGEGVVCKNYGFKNKYDRQVWGKIITNEFKEKHHKEMGAPIINNTLFVEEQIVRDYLTEAFVLKEKAKIESYHNIWSPVYIGELLGRVWYEFIRDELWDAIKEYKNPKIDFKLLNQLVIKETKKVIGV